MVRKEIREWGFCSLPDFTLNVLEHVKIAMDRIEEDLLGESFITDDCEDYFDDGITTLDITQKIRDKIKKQFPGEYTKAYRDYRTLFEDI